MFDHCCTQNHEVRLRSAVTDTIYPEHQSHFCAEGLAHQLSLSLAVVSRAENGRPFLGVMFSQNQSCDGQSTSNFFLVHEEMH